MNICHSSEDDYAAWHADLTLSISEGTGLREDIASKVAEATLRKLQERRGGRRSYIPTASNRDRHEAIRGAFRGDNHEEVCRDHGVSRATLYRVIGK